MDIFTRNKELTRNFEKYLTSENGQLNVSDMESGFSSIETLIANVYDTSFNIHAYAKFSEEKQKILLCEGSLTEQPKLKDLKLQTVSEYDDKTFAFVETCKKIKNYSMVDKTAYIFTDIGVIAIARYGKIKHVYKVSTIDVYTNDENALEILENFINDSLVEIPYDYEKQNISVCTNGSYGIRKTSIEIKPFDCDISKNYNDDIPYDKLKELINSDNQELILLHGEPGTGKTSIIKKLITDNPKANFLYFDFNLLTSFSDGKIFDFLMEHTNHVLIIEDCEKLFTDRNEGNKYLNSMLNLTDGIVGEAFAIKFICTFNCPTNKIDKAVLREGRLSLIYEFKKLTLEKTKALMPSATEPKTLAEIYANEDNGNHQMKKKIGF